MIPPKYQGKWEFVSARKVLPTFDYEGLHVVKLNYAVACGEVRVVSSGSGGDMLFLLISKSKRFIKVKVKAAALVLVLVLSSGGYLLASSSSFYF